MRKYLLIFIGVFSTIMIISACFANNDFNGQLVGKWHRAILANQHLETLEFMPSGKVVWTSELDGKKYKEEGQYVVEISRNIFYPERKHAVIIISPEGSKEKIYFFNAEVGQGMDNRLLARTSGLKFFHGVNTEYFFEKSE